MHLLPKSFQVASTSLAASTPCADLTLRLDIKNSGPFLKIRCKDSVKVTLVFLQRQKFFQKIVFFPFFGLSVEPNEYVVEAFCGYAVLFGGLFFCVVGHDTFSSQSEVLVDDGLVSQFNLVSCLRHAEVVRVSYEPWDIVQRIRVGIVRRLHSLALHSFTNSKPKRFIVVSVQIL